MEDDVSLISLHPAVHDFVASIIKNIGVRKFNYEEKIVIDADLIPKVSEKPMKAAIRVAPVVVKKPKPLPIPKKQVPVAKIPPARPRPAPQPVQAKKQADPPVRKMPPPMSAPVALNKSDAHENGKYGKISPLLDDPSVSVIECMGEGLELMIVRMGQKQKTRLVLKADQIREVLEKVADEAHIPLLDGVFRAVVKGFSINAVISEMIGSRFVIKKAMTY